jgi:hypothetical protein
MVADTVSYNNENMAVVNMHVEVRPPVVEPEESLKMFMKKHQTPMVVREQRAKVLLNARTTNEKQQEVVNDVEEHLDVLNIMLYEMDELTERCGKVESNYRDAQKKWTKKWEKLYDYKYIRIVKLFHSKKERKERESFRKMARREGVNNMRDVYRGAPFTQASTSKKLAPEALDKLLMSRKMTGGSGSVKSPTLQSSPGLTQHLLSQIGEGGKASKAIGF